MVLIMSIELRPMKITHTYAGATDRVAPSSSSNVTKISPPPMINGTSGRRDPAKARDMEPIREPTPITA